MPYKAGNRLPGERASRLGHLEVLKSELVNKLIDSFNDSKIGESKREIAWEEIPKVESQLNLIFGVDGSRQVIISEYPPYKKLAFVKTALLRVDRKGLAKIDKETPHPFALRDILSDSAIYHSTVFPLKHISIEGIKTYDAIRQIIFESISDNSLSGEIMETLKWISYEKWNPSQRKELDKFECPHCHKTIATLSYDEEKGECSNCGGDLFITDMLGFHQEMAEASAPDSVASNYMMIHEFLLLFTGIRFFWENNKEILKEALFVKDGPLSIRAQYSKLVEPTRKFLEYARNQGTNINIIGQEKTGYFCDHLQLIGRKAPENSIFIPDSSYVKEEIQNRPDVGMPYGKDTNYGAKVFVKLNDYHKMVLNIPFGKYKPSPQFKDLIGAERIFSTLPPILSNKYEGALLPIELAHGIASLSTYPSAEILKIFANI